MEPRHDAREVFGRRAFCYTDSPAPTAERVLARLLELAHPAPPWHALVSFRVGAFMAANTGRGPRVERTADATGQ